MATAPAPVGDGISEAAERAKKEADRAKKAAKSATDAAAGATAKAAAKDAFEAAVEAFSAADAARSAPPETAKDAAEAAAKKSTAAVKAADSADAAGKAAAAVGAPAAAKAEEEAKAVEEAIFYSQIVESQLTRARDVSSSISERQRALDIVISVAITRGGTDIDGGSLTIASLVVRGLARFADEPQLATTALTGLGDVLGNSAEDLVGQTVDYPWRDGNGSEILKDGTNVLLTSTVFQLGTNTLGRATQHYDVRKQRVAGSVIANLIASASVDEGDTYVDEAFRDLNVLARNVVLTQTDNHVRLGILNTLVNKGDAILKQETDVATAAAAKAKATDLKGKLDSATAALQTANDDFTAKDTTYNAVNEAVKLSVGVVATNILTLAKLNVELTSLTAASEPQADIDRVKKSRDDTQGLLKAAEQTLSVQQKNVADAAKAKNEADTEKTSKAGAKTNADTAYKAAKAEAESKSKANPVDPRALRIVLTTLHEISQQPGLPDRIGSETSFALAKFLQGEQLPEPSNLKFAATTMPLDGQPLAASDRPGVATIESGRIGVANTREFDAQQDVTNRPERGTRVAAPPQSLRKPGSDSSTPTTRTVTGATKVTGTAFVPAIPEPAPPATGSAGG